MQISKEDFKDVLRRGMIDLLESKRGTQTLLAQAIDENASYFSQIKRGNPVNAMHLKAVSIVFGPHKVLELLGINNLHHDVELGFGDRQRGRDIVNRLLELERMSPKVYDMVATYITGAHEAAKATAGTWEEIEKGGKPKEEEGFKQQREGTNE